LERELALVRYILNLFSGSTVFAEPEVIDAAAYEFGEEIVEKMLKVGESLLIDYEWGVYDLLVLVYAYYFYISLLRFPMEEWRTHALHLSRPLF
jgi:hypothetical protein